PVTMAHMVAGPDKLRKSQTGTSCHCWRVLPLARCCTTADPLVVPATSATRPLLRLTSVTKPPLCWTVQSWVLVPSWANWTSCVPAVVDDCGTSSTLPLLRLVRRLAPAVVVTTQDRLAVSTFEASTIGVL